MGTPNISQGERLNRLLVACFIMIATLLSWPSWFFLLLALLLVISAATGQCGTIALMKRWLKPV